MDFSAFLASEASNEDFIRFSQINTIIFQTIDPIKVLMVTL